MTGYAFTATMLDSYAFYRRVDYLTDEEIVNRLLRVRDPVPAPYVSLGTAWHAAMEPTMPPECRISEHDGEPAVIVMADGEEWALCLEDVMYARSQRPADRIGEMPVELNVGPHVVRMKLDEMHGLAVADYKVTAAMPWVIKPNGKRHTAKRFDVDNYVNARQGYLYLAATGARHFEYVLYTLKGKARDGLWRLERTDVCPLTAYPGIEDDVRSWVCELADFCDFHGIEVWRAA